MLSNTEKIDIINQHIRSIDYMIYNAELDLLEANAVQDTDSGVIAMLNQKINNLNLKKSALEAEKITLAE